MTHHIEKNLKEKTKVIKHKHLKLEQNSLVRAFFNLFLIPVLNSLPIKSRGLIKKSNKAVGDIVDNATNHKALEILYHNGYKKDIKKMYEKISNAVWLNTNNSKAVRNRLKIVNHEISSRLKELVASDKEEISIVSIAAGSARAVIEALEANVTKDKKISITFIDKSDSALEYSKNLLSTKEFSKLPNYSFKWISDTVNGFLDKNTEKFDIVEMVGLMDYFEDDRARIIFQKINNNLKQDGVFITANINDNSEKKFVTKAIGWPMIYRSAEHIGRLVHEAGFPHTDIEVYYEPLKIHSIIIARRKS
jgi:SAM-dependent methyltransferase